MYREFGFKIGNASTAEGQPHFAYFSAPYSSLNPQELYFLSVPLALLVLITWGKTILIFLSVILTLINAADLVLFGVWVHYKKSCWKSSIIISASVPTVLSCSEKRLVFSDPDTQFPTAGDAARKTLGRRPAIKLYCRKTQHIFSSTLQKVTKNYLSPECKAEVKINFQFKVTCLLFWLLKVQKKDTSCAFLFCINFHFFSLTVSNRPWAILDTPWFVISNLSCPCCSANTGWEGP